MKKLILVAGGSASGKTTIAEEINSNLIELGVKSILCSQDNYTICPSKDLNLIVPISKYNFDKPYAIDTKHLFSDIGNLLKGNEVMFPKYHFGKSPKEYSHTPSGVPDVIILEGTFVLYYEYLIEIAHKNIFIDVDESLRIERRISRDVKERGISPELIIERFNTHVKPSHDEFIQPTIKNADIIIKNNIYNMDNLINSLNIIDNELIMDR